MKNFTKKIKLTEFCFFRIKLTELKKIDRIFFFFFYSANKSTQEDKCHLFLNIKLCCCSGDCRLQRMEAGKNGNELW